MSNDTQNGTSPEGGAITDATVVDGHATEARTGPGTAVAPTAPHAQMAVAPQAEASELVARLATIREAMNTAMVDGIDYGKVPGVSKPTLLKPGAEKLSVLFQLDIQPVNEQVWDGEHLTVTSRATVYHAPTGTRMGYGEGMCTTREKKYAKRRQDRVCPNCGKDAIKRSKYADDQTGDKGWYCFAKIDGCGAQFRSDDPAIVGQEVGDRDNPDLADTYNTVLKIASKRARVDAVLAVTGASALFTQDVEDMVPDGDSTDTAAAPAALPGWADRASPELVKTLRKALAYMLNDKPDGDRVQDLGAELIARTDGVLTKVQCWAIVQTVIAHRKVINAAAPAAAAPAAAQLPVDETNDGPPPPDAGLPIDDDGTPPARPAPGTVRVVIPPNTGPQDALALWKAQGCTCLNPLVQAGRDNDCPIQGHAIAF